MVLTEERPMKGFPWHRLVVFSGYGKSIMWKSGGWGSKCRLWYHLGCSTWHELSLGLRRCPGFGWSFKICRHPVKEPSLPCWNPNGDWDEAVVSDVISHIDSQKPCRRGSECQLREKLRPAAYCTARVRKYWLHAVADTATSAAVSGNCK